MIRKENIEDIVALTSLQEGMLYHYIRDSKNPHYFEQLRIQISGNLASEHFELAWKFTVNSNEMLRSFFRWEKLKSPVRIVLKSHAVDFRYFDCSQLVDEEKEIERIAHENYQQGFDLTQVPFRVTLVGRRDNSFEMIIDYHHILYDGWSTGIVLKEFLGFLNEAATGNSLQKITKVPFKEFIAIGNKVDKAKHTDFWKNILNGFTEATELPLGTAPRGKAGVRKVESTCLSVAQRGLLETYLKKHKITLASFCYAIWGGLIARFSDTDDVVFGVVASGRNGLPVQFENVVGLFINSVPCRFQLSNQSTIVEIATKTGEFIGGLGEFENTPLTEIQACSDLVTNTPLFQSLVVVENYPLDRIGEGLENVAIESYSYEEATNFPLTITIRDAEKLEFSFQCDSEIYSDFAVRQLVQYFVNGLEEAISDETLGFNQISWLNKGELLNQVKAFNATKLDFNQDQTLLDLFRENVKLRSNSIALNFGGESYTFGDIDALSYRLAVFLHEKGEVGHGDRVVIHLIRSEWIILGPLAVLKLGAAYIPVDFGIPQSRLDHIVEDSEARFVLNESELDKFKQLAEESTAAFTWNAPSPEDLAYIIYTSGSTGMPKGVQVEHHSVLNFIHAMKDWFKVDDSKSVLSLTTNSFDVFVFESLLPLASGMRIVLANEDERLNGGELCKLLNKSPIDIVQMTPSRLSVLLDFPDFFRGIEQLLVAGEAFPQHLVIRAKKIFKGGLYNMYGPTETTVYSTGRNLGEVDRIDIGKPIANTEAFVMDKFLRIQPTGAKGELCIAGEGVARGYLNKDDLTAEKFVPHPFENGKIMYRTGDLVRWKDDGNIEFLGRIDEQVKIRGYRVELGEIDEQLKRKKDIKEVITIAFGEDVEKELCTYFVASQKFDLAELRTYLSEWLPEYMVPGYFIQLDEFPLTSSGKINKKALPDPVLERTAAYVEPTTEEEKSLVMLWADVLKVGSEIIGVETSFFELGGHSLKVTKLVSQIHKIFDVKIQLDDIFKAPTVKEQLSLIKEKKERGGKDVYKALPKAKDLPAYHLSFSQTRMYILQQLDLESVGYNMPIQLVFDEPMNIDRVEKSLQQLVQRHESLRTVFRVEDIEPRQYILNDVDFCLDRAVAERSELAEIVTSFVAPFDLEVGSLFRALYVSVTDGSDLLLIDMHHIITDGVSQEILEREFWQLYSGEELLDQDFQYRDYSEWVRSDEQQSQLEAQKSYWLDCFSGELPVLELPYDFRRPSVKNYEGSRCDFTLSEEDLSGLRRLCDFTESTLYMGLLTVISTWLWKLSGQKDIVVGSPIAARRHSDLEGIMGMFVNTLAIRTELDGNLRFSEVLSLVKSNTLGAYAHQEYGFEELVEQLKLTRDTSRNPLFDVMLVLQNQSGVDQANRPYRVEEVKHAQGQSKFDLSLDVHEKETGLYVTLSYSTQLFKAETIERFVAYFQRVIASLNVSDPVLSKLSVLSEEEQQYQLDTLTSTSMAYAANQSVVSMFGERVLLEGSASALLVKNRSFSYAELDAGSNGVANYLLSEGIGAGDRVGVLLGRDERLIMSLLGVLKSGAAYVPIDPSYPQDRIDYLLSDSACRCIIDDKLWAEGLVSDTSKVDVDLTPSQLAYVIYTSGSTGKPKGVMITHGNLSSFLHWSHEEFKEELFDLVYAGTSVCFDLSIFELFYSLTSGTPIRLLESALDMEEWLALDRNVLLNTVPSVLGGLLKGDVSLSNVTVLNLAGEPIPRSYIDQLDCNQISVRNLYGPSEDTTYSTCYKLSGDTEILIGRPIGNAQAYVLDEWNNLMPYGSIGELCLSGSGLSQGYLNRESLTAEKFIEHPFIEGERLYKTGDLVQWTTTEELRYIGRKDDQVKLRGYRIELGEIETALNQYPAIKECVVNVSGSGDHKILGAHYVAENELKGLEIQRFLGDRLPSYMIPTYMARIAKIPVNSNGKVDRRALPAFDFTDTKDKVAPANEMETNIRKIWSEVLELGEEDISTDANFFELGGHSLKATLMVTRIHRETGIRIPLLEVFKAPTIIELSQYVLALSTIHEKTSEEKPAKRILKI